MTALYWIVPQREREFRKALTAFERGDLLTSEQLLSEMEKRNPRYPLPLYRAWAAEASGQTALADRYLKLADQMATSEEQRLEIYLAEMSNAYLEHRLPDLALALEKGQELNLFSPYLSFFEGLLSYQKGEYRQALTMLNQFREASAQQEKKAQGWREAAFRRLFSPTWIAMHLNYMLLEQGELFRAQEKWEEQLLHLPSEDPLYGLGMLFLGQSYLKEADLLPLNERTPSYKIAQFYFERIGELASFPLERDRMVEQLGTHSLALLTAQQSQGLHFLHLLEQWRATESLDRIATTLGSLIGARGEEYLPLCKKIASEFKGSHFIGLLSESLSETFLAHLRKREGSFSSLWACLETLDLNPDRYLLCGELTKEQLFASIQEEGFGERAHSLLTFWNDVFADERNQYQLYLGLLSYAEMLWNKEGYEERGTQLMDTVLAMAPVQDRGGFLKEMQRFFLQLYTQAEEANMIKRLSLIHDACTYFHIETTSLHTEAKFANYLADADYLFSAEQYSNAQACARWLLKLAPGHQEALRLFGLASYYLGEYEQAKIALKGLLHPDPSAQHALILCMTLFPDIEENTLAKGSFSKFQE